MKRLLLTAAIVAIMLLSICGVANAQSSHGAVIQGSVMQLDSNIDNFSALTGNKPGHVMWYQNHGEAFQVPQMNIAHARGVTPIVSMQPHGYSPRELANGAQDAYFAKYARDAAAYGKPFYFRFAHEMNGDWYDWGLGVNGNTAEDYVDMYRHVHDIFVANGATNAKWIWSPNIRVANEDFAALYPGDLYVDAIGIDGYNWGTTQSWSQWQSFTEVFASTYDELATLSSSAEAKPMMVNETAAPEAGGSKAAWIRSAYLSEIPNRFPRLVSVTWFHVRMSGGLNWRVDSSKTALAAYKEGIASPYYTGTLP